MSKTGIIVNNLGTPDAPTAKAVRRYLKEFLSDQRVVEIPKLAWWPILNLIILNVRPKKSAAAYASIWDDKNGSPLLHYSQQITNQIGDRIGSDEVLVELGMRYGNPSLQSVLDKFKEQGVDRVIVLPLYPQYSATTTAATYDQISRILMSWRDVPALDFIRDYHDHGGYIKTMANHISEFWQTNPQQFLLFSFHGIPERNVQLGDPYQQQSIKTAELLAEELGLKSDQWRLTFQSRFGYQTWLQPYTDATLKALPSEGIKNVDVFCPGFPADCLETVEEIAVENKEYFIESGGNSFHYIPALNDTAGHVEMLAELVQSHI